jgi:hypothetical protein
MTPCLQYVLVLAALTAVVGCTGGSSNSDGSASSASYQAMLDACAAYCDEYVAADCVAGLTISECMEGPCSQFGSEDSAACHDAAAAEFECERSRIPICGGEGCERTFISMVSACRTGKHQ